MSETTYRHPELQATGLFSDFWGPSGQFPVQLVGTLTTGEYVYFRARGKMATLVIYPSEAAWSAQTGQLGAYSQEIVGDDDFPASFLAPDQAVELIAGWLELYASGTSSS